MTSSHFIGKKHLGSNLYTFTFEIPWYDMQFQAGEFIELKIEHPNPDERGDKRWFTVSNVWTDVRLEITTRYFGDKSSTFKKALFNLKKGDLVHFSDPMGDFVLPKDKKLRLLFVAGGIGVTPYMAMLKYMEGNNDIRSAKLIWKLNTLEDKFKIPYAPKEVEQLVITDNDLFKPEYLLEQFKRFKADRIYISGPEPMVKILNDGLLKLGLPKRVINTDYFPGYIN